jgi:NLR family CARD domain-containing protein 3
MNLLIKDGDFTSEGLIQGKKMTRASFKDMRQGQEPDLERQALVLQALNHFMLVEQPKPTSVVLHHCAVLKSKTLEPFLHENLDYLELCYCTQIKDTDLELIEKKCPRLKTLRLIGCPQLKFFSSSSFFSLNARVFPALEELHLLQCNSLTQIRIDAPFLKVFSAHQNPELKSVEMNAFPRLELSNCPLLDEASLVKRLAKNILTHGNQRT